MDRSKTNDCNLWHVSIKTRWRDASHVIWNIAKATKVRLGNVEKTIFFPTKENRSKVATLAAIGYW